MGQPLPPQHQKELSRLITSDGALTRALAEIRREAGRLAQSLQAAALESDEGVKQALRVQGTVLGMNRAVELILEQAEETVDEASVVE